MTAAAAVADEDAATTPLVAVVAVAAPATERAAAAVSAATTWAAPQLDLQRSLLIAPQAAPLCFPFLACAICLVLAVLFIGRRLRLLPWTWVHPG